MCPSVARGVFECGQQSRCDSSWRGPAGGTLAHDCLDSCESAEMLHPVSRQKNGEREGRTRRTLRWECVRRATTTTLAAFQESWQSLPLASLSVSTLTLTSTSTSTCSGAPCSDGRAWAMPRGWSSLRLAASTRAVLLMMKSIGDQMAGERRMWPTWEGSGFFLPPLLRLPSPKTPPLVWATDCPSPSLRASFVHCPFFTNWRKATRRALFWCWFLLAPLRVRSLPFRINSFYFPNPRCWDAPALAGARTHVYFWGPRRRPPGQIHQSPLPTFDVRRQRWEN